MHASSGATAAATGVGLLRDLTEGRGLASIWITLAGLDFDASAALVFPSRATGARGFHIWWGGVAGGVKAEAEGKKMHHNYSQHSSTIGHLCCSVAHLGSQRSISDELI